jgi:prepilin-type N-terminal cleavage/methylation domain-containing protein
MKTNHKMRRGFTLVELLVVIVIIAALAGLTAPMVIRQRKKADQTEAVSNARQVGLAMFEFENEYSSYPDSNTATAVIDATGSTLTVAGATSNDYFRQLIAANITQSEKMFYAKIPNVKKPDEDISSGKALDNGEVGFAYLLNGVAGFSAAGNPSRPLAVTPLLDNRTSGEFDSGPFDGKAIVLKMDNSVTSISIRTSDNTILLGGPGTGLLASGEKTVWGTSAQPTIAAPKLRTN